MAEEFPSKGKFVPYLLDLLALAFLFGFVDGLRTGQAWYAYSGCLVAAIVLLLLAFRWSLIETWIGSSNKHRLPLLAMTGLTLVTVAVVGYDIYDRHHPVNSTARLTTSQRPEDTDRTFTVKSPSDLLGFYRGRTALQADSLMKPFFGLWIKTEGIVVFLGSDGQNASVAAIRRPNDIGESPIECRFPAKWTVPLSRVSKGDIITFQGKITPSQNGQQLYLSPCELLDAK